MKVKFASFIFLFLLLIFACSQVNPKESCVTIAPINPNGDSELSLLMRSMFDDGMRIKEQIKNGEQPEILKKFEAIHTAKATKPSKTNNDKFKIFADAYLVSLKALENAEPDKVKGAYQGMVQSCMNCHRSMCPGPIVRIKKLNLGSR